MFRLLVSTLMVCPHIYSLRCIRRSHNYNVAAKKGNGHLVAAATQEGTVEIMDMRPRALFDLGTTRVSLLVPRS